MFFDLAVLSISIAVLIVTILFILPDELVMGCGQRRLGPMNLG
jgi:hypothetical protein